ncbi:hypothetical protein BCR42DRAFT_410097 [Absidia repens]|uniref:CHHC U11-48K-type domain-containing protein n=1 Tax=Absidia repens TaxID=90262 RepID=A0A1X2INL8_9FUNG|nr:hypothetical protein BCR42DRAFT_410097 [Absidia repens]
MEVNQKLEQVNSQLDEMLKTLDWERDDLKKWYENQQTLVPCPNQPQHHSIPMSLVEHHKQHCPMDNGQHHHDMNKKK